MTPTDVKAIRAHFGLSRREFAEKIGVSWSTVQAIETGRRRITDETRTKITSTFDLSADVLDTIHRVKLAEQYYRGGGD
ncbi:helix-turn-helix domain-containing protein [Numidum massiliense]|uniref:helix-turn-helix domain-containing protein n=1 Tax=Numidum massiliense TaxID=1522315 RepID=UPI0006D57E7C|nr:helix-turn-helix transcriptional regulator [Numidum massiliense]